MKRSRFSHPAVLILILVTLILAACGGTPAAEEPAAAATIPPTKTRIPLPTNDAAAQTAEENAESGQPGGMRTFTIVPEQSSASYLVDEEFLQDALGKLGIDAGEVDVVGTTENVSGQIQINLDDLAAPLGDTTITADLSTLKTDQDRRDQWIQENGPRFSSDPLASFTATGVEGLPDAFTAGEEVQFQLLGDLTVRGVSAPLVFDVTAVVEGDTLTGTAATRLLMSDLGIDPPNFARTLSVADEFGIRVNLVAREQ